MLNIFRCSNAQCFERMQLFLVAIETYRDTSGMTERKTWQSKDIRVTCDGMCECAGVLRVLFSRAQG